MEVIKDKKDIILPSLYQFYAKPEHINVLVPIISGYSQLSIRVLDWFVTNYAKKNNVIYMLPSGTHFNVHLSYKSQLKGYKKKMFDPFCRKKRISFYFGDNKCIITTIGQLNFFRWAIENNILNYVIDHIENITSDMNTTFHDTPTSSEKKTNSFPICLDLES
jgi:hypothetical protein